MKRLPMSADQYRQTATEAETQKAIVDALRYCGYTVLTTDRHRKGGGGGPDGITRGLPDLLVFDPAHPERNLKGLEVKRPSGGYVRPEQAALVEIGAVTIVRSVLEALAAVTNEEKKGVGHG